MQIIKCCHKNNLTHFIIGNDKLLSFDINLIYFHVNEQDLNHQDIKKQTTGQQM